MAVTKRESCQKQDSLSCARHVYRVDGLKETLSPNQREDNQQARVPLATVGWAYGKPHQNALVTMGGMWNS